MVDVTREIENVQALMRHLFQVRGSESALEVELKVPRSTISRIRHAEKPKELPEPETLLAIASAFRVEVGDILRGAVHFGRPGKAARRRYDHALKHGFPTKLDRLATVTATLFVAQLERLPEFAPGGLIVGETAKEALADALKRDP